MTEDVRPYTIAISKGAALVDETIALLSAWSPGQSVDELAQSATERDVLGKASAYRVRDIVRRVFAPRYLRPNESAATEMKRLLGSAQARQWVCDLGLLFSCRADELLRDATELVYWRLAESGQSTILPTDLLGFFGQAVESGRIPEQWSDAVSIKVARGLVGAWEGYRLVGPRVRGTHEILSFRPRDSLLVYLAYRLHFEGNSDSEVADHRDWRLFGLSPTAVRHQLQSLSNAGWWEAQIGGDLIQIDWCHPSMEEVLIGLLR